jgi:hypothetical protein
LLEPKRQRPGNRENLSTAERRCKPKPPKIPSASAVTLKAANGGHPKTGQWRGKSGQALLYSFPPEWSKEFRCLMRPEGALGLILRAVGPVGMWKSRCWRFPSAGENDGKPPFGFPRFPRRVISTGLLRRRRCLRPPALRSAFQHMSMMQQPIQHGPHRGRVPQQFPPVLHDPVRR